MAEVAAIARAAVGAFFVVSASLKLIDPGAAAEALEAVQIRPSLRHSLSRALAFGELALGAALLATRGPEAILAAAAALVVFTLFLVILGIRAPSVSCGCLGGVGPGDYRLGIARNLVLGGGLVVALLHASAPLSAMAAMSGLQVAVLVALSTEGLAVLKGLRARRTLARG
jgi:hypothetical protein